MVFIAAVLSWAALQKPPPLPHVKLPDGSVLILQGVTYGTNHVLGTPVAKVVSKWPVSIKRGVERVLGPRFTEVQKSTTARPCLKLWLRRGTPPGFAATNETASYTALAADSSGFVSGTECWFSPAYPWTLDFEAFPRRDRFITIKIGRALDGEQGEHHTFCGSFRVRNPVFKAYPQWTPDPKGTRRTNGPVVAQLTRLLTGTDGHANYSTTADGHPTNTWNPCKDYDRTYSVIDATIHPINSSPQGWHITSVTVSDATGNSVKNTSSSRSGEWQGVAFAPSLWPSESAWKLAVKMKRHSGFTSNETFAFTDIPLPEPGSTNQPGWRTNLNGCQVTLAEVCRRNPPVGNYWTSRDSSYVKIVHSPLPDDLYLDLREALPDGAKENKSTGWSSGGLVRHYWLRDLPADAKTLSLFFAVHKGVEMEFLAKPEVLRAER